MRDNAFTTPARGTGGQVGFAVPVFVKGLFDFVAFEVIKGGDTEVIGVFFDTR